MEREDVFAGIRGAGGGFDASKRVVMCFPITTGIAWPDEVKPVL
jgi:hypothetical protein